MEDFFHSADYAYRFVERIIQSMEDQGIHKKILIYSHKTESDTAMQMMRDFGDIIIFIHDDIEYFFTALFGQKKPLENIPNLLWREDMDSAIQQSLTTDIVDADIATYIHGAYHNGYYTNFPKSKDISIALLDEDDEGKSIHMEMAQPRSVLTETIR
jgi:hypothetical protein